MSMDVTVAAVEKVLAEFKDPETGRSVTQTQQARDVQVAGDKVTLTLALTSHSAPIKNEMKERLVELLRRRFPSLTSIDVNLVVHERAAVKLGQIGLTAKSVIAVGSGKGGVGKSTVAATIALGLKRAGCKVGLMDADVYGPSIPHLLGLSGKPVIENNKLQPIMFQGMPTISMGYLVPAGEAVVWRGPMLHGAITQFLRDTAWGDLDYLIIDMPPGTGDIALTLSQQLPLTGAVVVCTPQQVALIDAVKAIAMFRKVNIPLLGMVENMSGFICPDTGKRYDIFGSGGARQAAEELKVPFLGEVPLNMQIRINGDEGLTLGNFDDPILGPYLEKIVTTLVRNIADNTMSKPPSMQLPMLG
ncbi:Flagellum site-determining protein YlxH [Anatilimnocola aggregata]|uniref:Iron-sulfur cluster carrier protein n=2 Tax=Anatilimnocola aggregata TaxID=2528021 RepID=A0A517YIH4_9BACT|nr:Flagellum site-determining protein YlxH [Anatilimnocola aggregata]